MKELYGKIEGNYNEAITRFKTDDRIKMFLKMFLGDTSFANLKNAMESEDYEAAFMAAHTLKGVLANMAFTDYFNSVSSLTELLRGGKDIPSAKKMYPEVLAKGQNTEDTLKAFLGL